MVYYSNHATYELLSSYLQQTDDQLMDEALLFAKRKRRPNFSENEKFQLLEELEKRKDVLCPPPTSTLYLSARMKQDAWTQITEELNRNNTYIQRSVMEVQKKWKNMCFAMKEEITKQKRKIEELGELFFPLHKECIIHAHICVNFHHPAT